MENFETDQSDNFGYDKDGDFEGYAEQAKINKYIEEKIKELDATITPETDPKTKEKIDNGIADLKMLQRNLMRLGEGDITRKKLEYYRNLVDMEYKKALGQYKFKNRWYSRVYSENVWKKLITWMIKLYFAFRRILL